MVRSKLLWFLWLCGCLLLWIMSDDTAIGYLTAASFLIPVFLILINQFAGRRLNISLSAAQTAEKNAPLQITVHAENTSWIPCPRVRGTIVCTNILTGERKKHMMFLAVNGKKSVDSCLQLTSVYCGKLQMEVEKVDSLDIFGISCCHTGIKGQQTAALILPEIYPEKVLIADSEQNDMESSDYSMYHPGSDPSEIFAIREYRAGDSLKQIHWKLSEKLGETVIREPGLPISNSILILLDTEVPEGKRLPAASVRSALGELAVSLSQSLCDQAVPHTIGWMDWKKGLLELRHITDMDSMMDMLPELLAAETVQGNHSITEIYGAQYGVMDYAHLVLLSSCPVESMQGVPWDCQTTNLVCGDLEMDADGVICFKETEVAEVLCYLEI